MSLALPRVRICTRRGARGYYNLARKSARKVGDHRQRAAALAYTAFIPAADYGFGAALDYLRTARDHVAKRPDNRVVSGLCAVGSKIRTNAALAAINLAQETPIKPRLNADLPWFHYYGAARMSGSAGYTTLRMGRTEKAHSELTGTVNRLSRAAVKQRAVFLAHIATFQLACGDLDEACWTGGDTAEQFRRTQYAIGLGRLRAFRAAVGQWSGSIPVRALDEQLAALG